MMDEDYYIYYSYIFGFALSNCVTYTGHIVGHTPEHVAIVLTSKTTTYCIISIRFDIVMSSYPQLSIFDV